MAKEIERRFLVDNPPAWEMEPQKLIKQGYVLLENDKQLRIRVVDSKSFLCLKYTKELSRDEYEYEIPLIDGLEILGKCEYTLEKIRKTIIPPSHNFTIDFDTYPNGITIAEVEFKSEKECQEFKALDWFGEEVTGKREYSNITLAKENLKF